MCAALNHKNKREVKCFVQMVKYGAILAADMA